MSILDHLTVNVRDYARSKAFYQQALAPLGITLVSEYGEIRGRSTTRITTEHSSSTPTGTISRPSTTRPRSDHAGADPDGARPRDA